MNRRILCLTALLLAGCAAAGTGGIQSVFRNYGEYEINVTGKTDALTIEKLAPQFGSFFVEFGADSCLTADFQEKGRTWSVHMTTFLSDKGALGAYEFSRPRDAEPLEIADHGSRNAEGVQFVRGKYLVTVRPKDGTDRESTAAFAGTLAKRISGSTFSPVLYSSLLKDGLVPGSELYFMGPKAFGARFSPELAEALSIGSSIEGVSGQYTLQSGETVTLVKIRFSGRNNTVQAVYDYIQTREGASMIRPSETRNYYTIFNPDNTETYIAEYSDWMLFIPEAPRGGKAQWLFEFALRSI